MNFKKTIAILSFFIGLSAFSQVERIEPPYWWSDMKNTQLELLVYGKNIGNYEMSISNNVAIEKVTKPDNLNYQFITIDTKNLQPQTLTLTFSEKGKTVQTLQYEIKKRELSADAYKGFDSSDVIFLVTPDRFVNGDTSNDIVSTMNEKTINRDDDYARHGGDIRGIINHLDYIENLGFTAIWPMPLLTNDMYRASYHGYAMTDFYQVDPRYGTLEEYIELSQKGKQKGIKLIMDQVANHCGLEHWWMKDLPFNDWVNYQEDFENKAPLKTSNHRRTTNQDSYGSKYDRDLMNQGWFVSAMPDLNQRNPFLATYLIQNSIWWIETLQLGGIRQDTYPYPDKTFMSKWASAIMTEYPNFSIVGEEWSLNPLLVAYWQQGKQNKDGYESNLTSSMDFPMQHLTVQALTEEESWDKGLVKIYEGLANDFAYANPNKIMIFPDNHDMDRIFTQLKEDVTNTKMALSYMMLLPRIPQLYYGTEILMQNTAKPGDHGLIRTDFPGGWQGDKVNAFTGEGLTAQQKDMQQFTTKLLNYRKQSKAIHQGKTIHFAPDNAVYTIVRQLDDEVVVLFLNKNNEPVTIDLKKYSELNLNGKSFKNVITDETFIWNDSIAIPLKGATLLTTKQ
uniref:glycoside hydrolase family 13 protein n=1 Tax=Gelidibacter sp. TaxID=2018083 RepID=UPI00404AB4F0